MLHRTTLPRSRHPGVREPAPGSCRPALNKEWSHLVTLEILHSRRELDLAVREMRAWDESLYQHVMRVAELAAAVARAMGFSPEEVELARLGGLLHDFAKVTWPREMIAKPFLDADDLVIVRAHPVLGADLVRERIPGLDPVVLRIIREHHERDGAGYPFGLPNGELHPLSRVVACVECFVAMTERRPYRTASLTREEALKHIIADGLDVTVARILSRLPGVVV